MCNPCVKPSLYGTAHYISHNDYYTQQTAHSGDCCELAAEPLGCFKLLRKMQSVHLRYLHPTGTHQPILSSDGLFITSVIKILTFLIHPVTYLFNNLVSHFLRFALTFNICIIYLNLF